jgi:hypothetical protein
MSVTDQEAEDLVKRLREVAKEEEEYENRATFWSLLAEEAADTIAELLLRKTIKTYLHEGTIRH